MSKSDPTPSPLRHLFDLLFALGVLCIPSALAGLGLLVAPLAAQLLAGSGFAAIPRSQLTVYAIVVLGMIVALTIVPGIRYFFLNFPKLWIRAIRSTPYWKRPLVALSYLIFAWLLIVFGAFSQLFLALPALGAYAALEALFLEGYQWWLAASLFVVSIPPIAFSVATIRRAVWIRTLATQTELLPTSRIRGAAAGIVELQGIVRAQSAANTPAGVIVQGSVESLSPMLTTALPFELEDPSGRVQIFPPTDAEALLDGRIDVSLTESLDGTGGSFQLREGDEVFILGRITTEEVNGERRRTVRPATKRRTRFYKFQAFREVFSAPDVFLLTSKGERGIRRRLFSMWRSRLLLAVPWALGSLTILAYVLLITFESAGICVGPCRAAKEDPVSVLQRSGDNYFRYLALRALDRPRFYNDPAAIGTLFASLVDPDDLFRKRVGEVLVRYPLGATHQSMAGSFLRSLSSQSPEARKIAARALANMGPLPESAAPKLITALDDEKLFAEVAPALAKIPARAWFGPMRERLRSSDLAVRMRTVEALGKSGEQGAQVVTDVTRMLDDRYVQLKAIYALEELGPVAATAAVPALSRFALQTTHEAYMRGYAVRALERFTPPANETVELLIGFLADDQNAIDKQTIIHALGVLGGSANRAIPLLAKRASDGDGAAAHAIEKLAPGKPGDVRLLIQALDASHPQIREAIAKSLGKYGPAAAPAVPQLIAMLTDEWWPQKAAAESLQKIGYSNADAVRLLVEVLGVKHDFAAGRAMEILVVMAPRRPDAVPILNMAITKGNRGQKYYGAWVLGRIGAPAAPALDALRALEKEAANQDGELMRSASNAIRSIQQAVTP